MSGNYQHLQKYKGSLYGNLKYSGIEYDFEVPDNQVISSPGGLSGIHHHYTKGMYSPESSYSDIYAGEPPAYPAAEFGNLYQVGQSAPYYMGEFQQPIDQMYTQNGSLTRRDNFVPGMELISPPDTTRVTNPPPASPQDRERVLSILDAAEHKLKNLVISPNPWAIFILLFLLWLSFDFWFAAGEGLIISKFHGGQPLNWKWYTFYAIIFTIAFVLVAKYTDISILKVGGGD